MGNSFMFLLEIIRLSVWRCMWIMCADFNRNISLFWHVYRFQHAAQGQSNWYLRDFFFRFQCCYSIDLFQSSQSSLMVLLTGATELANIHCIRGYTSTTITKPGPINCSPVPFPTRTRVICHPVPISAWPPGTSWKFTLSQVNICRLDAILRLQLLYLIAAFQ